MGKTREAAPALISDTPDAVVEWYCTIAQVASRMQVDERTVEREIAVFEGTKGRDGLGPRYKFGRAVRLKVGDVNAYLARHRIG